MTLEIPQDPLALLTKPICEQLVIASKECDTLKHRSQSGSRLNWLLSECLCVWVCVWLGLCAWRCVCEGIVLRLLSMFWWCPSGSYKPQCQNRTACQSTWTVMSALWVTVCVCVCVYVSRSVFVCFVMQNQGESIMRCLKSQTNANKWGLRPGLVAQERDCQASRLLLS